MPTKPDTETLGGLIDTMFLLREQKRALNAEIAAIEAQTDQLEEKLMLRMEKEGTDKATGKTATASVTTNIVGNVTDWVKLNAYIKKTGKFELYQRRLSDPAVRELLEQKGAIPGVEPFKKSRLNLRVIT